MSLKSKILRGEIKMNIEKLNQHFATNRIPLPWCKRIDKFKPSKNLVVKHDWIIWRKLEARRNQNSAYNTCLNRIEILSGMWSKIYH